MTLSKNGGEVVDAGGFGCVFEPDLKCVGQSSSKQPVSSNQANIISKLMTKKHASEELREIQIIKQRVQHIPRYQDFFLLDNINICQPAKLSATDLKDFDTKCKPLTKKNITESNINESLDKLMVLNMPHGGMPVDDYIYRVGSNDKFLVLNQSLIDLLVHGIIPMNKSNVFHGDIKDSNVLVGTDLKTRLIDWGLSVDYIPHQNNPFPNTWRNRPFQYNVPFSVILFSDHFAQQYSQFNKTSGSDLSVFIVDFIYSWIHKRGLGHYKFINDIMYILFHRDIKKPGNKHDIIEMDYMIAHITEYLMEVLENFTSSSGIFQMRKYLDTVFIHIVDIWGFISVYYPLLDFLNTNYDTLTRTQHEIFELLKQIFLTHMYSPRIIPNTTAELVADLNLLNDLLERDIMENRSTTARGLKIKRHPTLRRNSSFIAFKRTRKKYHRKKRVSKHKTKHKK